MYYCIYALDKPASLELRLANREAHLAYAKGSGKLDFAGPLLDEDGNMCGSLIILKAESKAEAEAFVENDPYNQAGLFERIEIRGVKKP